jgi:ribonuclease VapC
MIVVDSSALIAILLKEPEKQAFENAIADSDRCVLSAVNAHETATVLRLRHGPAAVEKLWQFLADSEIEIVPFDEAQVREAAIAFNRYGKGIDPKARLNLSDCAAYALAKSMKAPLLFKGEDFAQTDLPSVVR